MTNTIFLMFVSTTKSNEIFQIWETNLLSVLSFRIFVRPVKDQSPLRADFVFLCLPNQLQAVTPSRTLSIPSLCFPGPSMKSTTSPHYLLPLQFTAALPLKL